MLWTTSQYKSILPWDAMSRSIPPCIALSFKNNASLLFFVFQLPWGRLYRASKMIFPSFRNNGLLLHISLHMEDTYMASGCPITNRFKILRWMQEWLRWTKTSICTKNDKNLLGSINKLNNIGKTPNRVLRTRSLGILTY